MPYEAAKAIAATFCWKMRYALTPVFGLDFPDTCLPPDDPHYGEMILDQEITTRCTEEAAAYRLMEIESRNASTRASPMLPSPLTPSTPTHPRPYKELRPKTLKLDTASHSSGYTTGSSTHDDKYQLTSNNNYYRNIWTPANTPRSVGPSEARLPSPRDMLAGITTSATKRNASQMSDSSSGLSSPAVSPKTKTRRLYHGDEGYDGDSSGSEGRGKNVHGRDGLAGLRGMEWRMIGKGRMPSDEKAAYLLMGLRLQKDHGGSNASGNAEGNVLGRKRRFTG